MKVNYVKVAIFTSHIKTYAFNAIHENQILAKISEFTVIAVKRISSKICSMQNFNMVSIAKQIGLCGQKL